MICGPWSSPPHLAMNLGCENMASEWDFLVPRYAGQGSRAVGRSWADAVVKRLEASDLFLLRGGGQLPRVCAPEQGL